MSQPVPYLVAQGLLPSASRCFLCGEEVDDSTETQEHVFPKWLLNRFDLWNEPLTLLNGSTIKYRQLVIACCRPCNNDHLSQLENRVQEAFRDGIDGLTALRSPDLYLWLVKVYYGLLFRNLTLVQDQRDSTAGSIVTPEDLSRFRFLHLMLQGIRGFEVKIENGGTPGSCVIMAAQTTETGHRSLNWDYFDVPHAPFLAVRVGPIAIFAGIADFGAFLHFAANTNHLEAARHLKLHPAQFHEFAALSAAIAMWVSENSEFEVDVDGSDLTITFDGTPVEIPPFMHTDEFRRVWVAISELGGRTGRNTGGFPITFLFEDDQRPRHMSMEDDVNAGRLQPASIAKRMGDSRST